MEKILSVISSSINLLFLKSKAIDQMLKQDRNKIPHFAIEWYIVKQRCLLPDGLMQKKPYHPTTTKMQIFARHIYSRKELLHACNLMAHVSISFFRGFFFATQKITTHTSLFILKYVALLHQICMYVVHTRKFLLDDWLKFKANAKIEVDTQIWS